MLTDPYAELGLAKSASADDIRKAYRRLAKELHPDARPGDAAAEERFKRVTAAYNLLSDDAKRRRFDRGEIDAEGNERPAFHGHPGGFRSSGEQFSDLEDILSGVFGADRAGPRAGRRGEDMRYRLQIGFLESINGGRKRVVMGDGKTLDLVIPEGVRAGQVLRLRGQGGPGARGAPPGDALVEIDVASHAHFRRDGDDVRLDLPVTVREAVLGARVRAPTPSGPVTLTVPKGSNSGDVLRLRGRGAKGEKGRGDQFVTLMVVLPERPDAELVRFITQWGPDEDYNPRDKLDV